MDLKLYIPQRQALITQATEVLYGGSLGGGKSYLARVASIIYSVEVPGLITYLFRRTFKEVMANHVYTPGGYLEMLEPMLKDGEVVYSKSDYAFTFYNGSRIQLAHSQYESDIYSHQGAQIGFLIVDEATQFTHMMIRFIRTRVRLGSLVIPEKWRGLFPRILYTANPGGVGHHYFKSGFVDHGPGHVFTAEDDDGGMKREFVPSALRDNKILLINDPDYAKRVRGLGSSAQAEAMLSGNWDILGTGMFADKWDAKVHVVKPFNIPNSWNVHRGYDYGSSAPAAVAWFAESDGTEFEDGDGNIQCYPKGTIVQIGELYFANKHREGIKLAPREQGRRIRKYELDEEMAWRVQAGPADNSIFHKEPGHASIADDMAKEQVVFIRSDKSSGSRVLGVGLFRQRLENSSTREGPGFYVFNTCYHTLRTVPSLERDEKDEEDVDTNGEDHFWDVIRYRVLMANRTVSEVKVVGF